MGQYFRFINYDKKEYISPSDYDNLLKVMEHSYQGNKFMCAIEKLLETEWKGDRVLYVGDYVDEFYENEKFSKTLKSLVKEFDNEYLYDIPEFQAKKVKLSETDLLPTRYLYNNETKEYVDLKTQPIQWSGYDETDKKIYGTKIHPLSILLCASNGSGGSYYGKDMHAVGSWVNSLGNIEIGNELKKDYKELKVSFDENKTKNSNIEILKSVIRENVTNHNIKNAKSVNFYDDLFLDENETQELTDYANDCISKTNEPEKATQNEPDICDD